MTNNQCNLIQFYQDCEISTILMAVKTTRFFLIWKKSFLMENINRIKNLQKAFLILSKTKFSTITVDFL